MANYQTTETEEGTKIQVEAEKEIALIIRENNKERIYLPPFNAQQDTYYVEPEQGMTETKKGYQITYPGNPTSIELFSK